MNVNHEKIQKIRNVERDHRYIFHSELSMAGSLNIVKHIKYPASIKSNPNVRSIYS